MTSRDSRRSEKVRQRLRKESKAWIDQASSRLTNPVHTSKPNESMTRNPVIAGSIQAHKNNHFFRIGWRLLSFILTIAFAYGLYTMWNDPIFRISTITITGLQRISETEILEKLDIYDNRIFSIDANQIKRTLARAYPELRNISVHLIMPQEVSIQLIERQPMIAWNSKQQNLWIDAEGFLIPARTVEQELLTIKADSLPTFQLALEDKDEKSDIKENSIKNIVKDKPPIKNNFQQDLFFTFPKQITPSLLTAILQLNAWMPDEKELLYESIRGLGWKDTRGWNVFVGSKLENINDKMLMYETIIRKLDEEGIKPTMVSVEFLHAPYYRLEN